MKENNLNLCDPLDEAQIKRRLGYTPLKLHVLDCVDSTNNEAKRYALAGGEAPAVFLADKQTAGRGRIGRSFYSPPDTGIYLSLLLKAAGELFDNVLLTSASAVAALQAIQCVTGISVQIKWVNDLYYNNKKVCGILAETFSHEDELYVIIGVGVNLYTEDFPDELADKAGSLLPEKRGLRNQLAAELISRLYELTVNPSGKNFIETYRAHSMVLGCQVTYIENDAVRQGKAEDIDDRGRLLIRHEDNTLSVLSGGEISLRM